MIKEVFCKIIELPEEQVLVEKSDQGEESAPFLILLKSVIEKVKFQITLSYDNEKDRNKNFDKINVETAKILVTDFKDSDH